MGEPLPGNEAERLLGKAPAGRLGLSCRGVPYVVPLCHVLHGGEKAAGLLTAADARPVTVLKLEIHRISGRVNLPQ